MWCLALTSHTGACARPTRTRNKPWVTVAFEIFFGKLMLALPCRTVDHGDAVCLGITANATAEPAGQPHKVGVLERLVRSGQRPPPHPEPARTMAHAEVRV